MTVLYVISKYVTVIGASLKALWEQVFCRILGIALVDVNYMQSNELCGHVDHDFTDNKLKSFLLCYLPGMMNRVFGYGMVIGGYLGLFYIEAGSKTSIFWIYLVMLYVGISLMCNNAPLYEDALQNWDLFYGKDSNTKMIFKILAFVPSAYFLLSAWMEKHAVSLLVYIVAILFGIIVL